jgi:3-hydroxyisobutyrate dehydrogenase
MDIAVLGMGRMGRALAGRLLAGGHQVTIWNRTPAKAPEVVAAGARELGSIADAVGGAQVAITSLANDDAVRAVAGGIQSALKPDAIYADASTTSPALSRQLAETFRHFVAMPILGGPAEVLSGRASYLLGGAAGDAAALEPAVATLSDSVRRYPEAPPATTAKLVNNLLLLASIVDLAEGVAVGRAGGLTDEQLHDLLQSSVIVPPGIRNRFEGILAGHQDPGWWSIALGAKDLGLAVELAQVEGRDVPVAVAVRDRYQAAAAGGLADLDVADISRPYSSRT